MSQLWLSASGQWQPHLLAAPASALTLRDGSLHLSRVPTLAPPLAELCHCPAEPGSDAWLLLAPTSASVRVNGHSVLGLRRLRHQDEIRFSGQPPIYFSTERLAVVQPFPGAERPVHCVRCRQEIVRASPAVQCPGCGLWHHADAAAQRPCWSYAPTCASCSTATTQNGFAWIPEEAA